MSFYFRKRFERGFGTYPLTGDDLRAAVQHAVNAGYRAFDTAQMYRNEAETGAALAQCGVARAELCITTKVSPANFAEGDFLPSVERSLRDLRIDQADVLLLHWPPRGFDVVPSLRLLNKALAEGFATHVGVSNYNPEMMRLAADIINAPVITNQVEFHPLLDQSALLDAARLTGIPLSAYCAVARGEVFKYPLFAELGTAYGKSAAQIVQRWTLQKGVSVNTMSTKPENIAANFEITDFTLSSVDMARIDALNSTGFAVVDTGRVPV